MRRLLFTLLLLGLTVSTTAQVRPAVLTTAEDLRLPNKNGSVKFAVIGDSGTGDSHQRAVANELTRQRTRFPFDFAIMLGDNLYGTDSTSAFVRKFEEPYKALLSGGVKFYAALGNHDDPNQRLYKLFNMNGERYYTFKPSPLAGVRFFVLDSNYMDPPQIAWLEKELGASGSDWKIAYFHHPIYSSGDKHGANEILKGQIEPLFIKHRVNVVFTGHEHFYERIKPQGGIAYFIAGSSAKLRRGDNTSAISEKVYDDGYTFMLVEIDGDDLYFQTVTDKGLTVDYGVIRKGEDNTVTGTSTATGTTGTGAPGAAPAATGAPAGRGTTPAPTSAPAPAGRQR